MAIAYVNSGTAADGSGTSVSGNYTAGSGANRIMFFGVILANAGDTLTGVSFNSVAASFIGKKQSGTDNIWRYLYVLVNPDSGTHTVAGSASSSSSTFNISVCEYSGAKQTGQPDNSVTQVESSPATSSTATLTTSADNCWAVFASGNFNSSISAGTGSTLRHDTGGGYMGWVDTNGPKTPAGSVSLQVTGSSAKWSGVMASFAPVDINPPTVTTSAATNILVNQATGNGNVTSDGGDTVTERGFCWSTSANPTTGDSKVTVSGTTGSYTGSITGLKGKTLYHYRAYAINGIGTSYGADTEFTSAPGDGFLLFM